MNFIKERYPKKNTHRTNGRPNRNPGGNNKKNASTIDPRLFTKKAVPKEEVTYVPTRGIIDLPIDARIKANLIKKGYVNPTEIQDKTMEVMLSGRDVMGIAQTGTGKTGAFLIPIINRLLGTQPASQVLIVVPTRELAVQVDHEFKSIAKDLNIFSACFIGGTSVNRDIAISRKASHLVIGTPGRLNDLARQKAIHFNRFTTLVLDEFDRLLDMGFSRDIQHIVKSMTLRKQTILYSATLDKNQKKLIQELLHNPAEVHVSAGNVTADHIDQEAITVDNGKNKQDVLISMIRDNSFRKVLVFAETKRGVSKLCKSLVQARIRADEIHGNKSQNYRLKALNDFKAGRIQVLIATDVAARGLDISEVTHVINYQPPKNFDSYIHRIGRTGRAGKTGKAYTFIN